MSSLFQWGFPSLSDLSAHPGLVEAEITVLDGRDVVERVDGQVLRLDDFELLIVMKIKQLGEMLFFTVMCSPTKRLELLIVMKTKQIV